MGSLFAPKQPAPPPPPPPTIVRDEVNRVEQVPVTNADGSVTYVTRALPLTAEEQAQKDQINQIMQDSLKEIQKLSTSDYQPDEQTQKVLNQWQDAQNKLLSDQQDQRSRGEEETLARRGLSDSSAAQAVRRQRQLDGQDAQKNLQLQKDELANQVRGERLGLQQNLYNLALNQTDAATVRTQQAAIRGQSDVAALNAQRQASLLDYYNAQQRGGSPFTSALGTGLGGSLGRMVGGAVSSPFGSVAGSFLGSLFGRR